MLLAFQAVCPPVMAWGSTDAALNSSEAQLALAAAAPFLAGAKSAALAQQQQQVRCTDGLRCIRQQPA